MAISFNFQTLPGVITGIQRPVVARQRVSEVVRGGSYSQGALIAAKRIIVKGIVKGAVSLAQQTAILDNLNAVCTVGGVGPLVIEAGRHYQAEVESVTETIDPRRLAVEYEVVLFCPSGSAESDTEISANITAFTNQALPGIVTVSGNERVRPVIRIQFSAVNAGALVLITNATTGESLLFAPTSTTQRYIQCETQTIVLQGGADATGEWVSGDFPTLVPGSNGVSYTLTNCTVTGVFVHYYPRYR